MPEHKFAIVDVLQQRKHTVGMTGDGVNDAPALKQANIGIAVQGATDAARAAADIVLMAPGLSVIIHAIVLSRQVCGRHCHHPASSSSSTVPHLTSIRLPLAADLPADEELLHVPDRVHDPGDGPPLPH